MKRPIARPLPAQAKPNVPVRPPRAFDPGRATAETEKVESFTEPSPDPEALPPPKLGRMSLVARLAWATGGLLVSLALGLAADALVRDLYARAPWLGWIGIALLALFVVAALALALREFLALRRLRVLDRLRDRAAAVLASDDRRDGRAVLAELHAIYAGRPDLARARETLDRDAPGLFDGADVVRLAERTLIVPLDGRARALTAAAARRVALVTAVSPRAVVDIAFVAWESIRLAGAVARLYGARPGILGSLRLTGAVLSHLAVTGGLALTDGAIEQLVGQGLAARISTRLGEGLVNGLMTVRVGIAAIRVVRPVPFDTQRTPQVRDFIGELANLAARPPPSSA
jgi:putative membrane protein